MADDDSTDEDTETETEGATDEEEEEEEEEEEKQDEEPESEPEETEPVPIGVKLGSTRTVITLPDEDGDDQLIRTLTCIATYEDAITGEEKVLYGEEAATEYADRVQFMLRSGLPENEDSAELATRFIQELVEENALPSDSIVVYAIPTIDNEEGLNNLNRIIEQSGIGDTLVRSYPESLCGSIPAVGDDLEAIEDTFIAVNMGSTNLEACAYRRGEQIMPFTTGGVTGNEVDRQIVQNVEEETQGRVNIDLTTAREYKEEHADFDDFEPFSDVVQQPGGGSHEFTIERSIMDACNDYLDDVVDEVANSFLPELANDYMKVYQRALAEPIVLTGGMACLPGVVDAFETRLIEELQREIDATAPDRPDLAAAVGARRIAGRLVDIETD
ncbi:MAG: hypothetical protein SVG88_12050 [Halobacteriales archaeon]|nr:hypothetical protein [Halobacteriales archaeon]